MEVNDRRERPEKLGENPNQFSISFMPVPFVDASLPTCLYATFNRISFSYAANTHTSTYTYMKRALFQIRHIIYVPQKGVYEF